MGEPGRDTSGVTTRVVVLYVREHGGDQAVTALLEHAGETRGAEDLLDEHGWSSYDQKIRLFRAAVEVLGDPGAVRKIGQFMLRSRIALPLLVLLRALGSPSRCCATWPTGSIPPAACSRPASSSRRPRPPA